MNISLDYDQTYTRDPKAWDEFIKNFKALGHTVYCVTMRYNNVGESKDVIEALGHKVDGIYFTGRKAKQKFMFKRGICIDVWIDDMPSFITGDALA